MASNGDPIPNVTIKTMGENGPEDVSTGELFGAGKSVLFGVPGAFTPGCDRAHLPGFVEQADELFAKGVDRVACIAVNDAFVMDAGARSRDVGDKIVMLADGNGEFTKAIDLEMDGSGFGLGEALQAVHGDHRRRGHHPTRRRRQGCVDVSSCGAVLGRL